MENNKNSVHNAEMVIKLEINEKLYKNGMISKSMYDYAKTAILKQ